MGPPTSTLELARAREQAAVDLEAAIGALGVAYRRYGKVTMQLADRVGAHLARSLEVPIVLHCVQAGLGGLLERKLTGTPACLFAVVEAQHEREGLGAGPPGVEPT